MKQIKRDSPEYHSIHSWLIQQYGKAKQCSSPFCSKLSKRYEWALLKGKNHFKDVANYAELCVLCHNNYDRNVVGKYAEIPQNRAAQLLGKKSADSRRKKMGEKAFKAKMKEIRRLGIQKKLSTTSV